MKNRKIVYLVYHVKEREYKILDYIRFRSEQLLLDYEFEIMGLEEAEERAYNNSRLCAIISFPMRTEYVVDRLACIKYVTGCKLITMETEGLMNFDDERILNIRIGQNTYSERLVDYYYVMGPVTRDKYQSVLLNSKKVTSAERVRYSGYFPYDLQLTCSYMKSLNYAEKLFDKGKPKKRTIVFLTGFANAEETIEQMIIMDSFSVDENGMPSKEEIEIAKGKIKNTKIFRDKYIDMICRYSKKHVDELIIVKPHPVELSDGINISLYRERFEVLSNVIFLDEDISLSRILPNTDGLVHYGSTSGMEAYLYMVPTILITSDYSANTNGFLYESTYSIDIDDYKTVDENIANAIFERNLLTEQFIYDYFGMKLNDIDCHPIDDLIEHLSSDYKAQVLSKQDLDICVEEETRKKFVRGGCLKVLSDIKHLKLSNIYKDLTRVRKLKKII